MIERVLDIPALMKELVRVFRDGAEIEMVTPHFTSIASWIDPTHVHHLGYRTFENFESELVEHYTGGNLVIARRKLSFGGGLMGLTGRLLFRLSPKAYEAKWCFIFRASTLRVALRVEKPTGS